jgi:hypothetical protein
VDSGFELIAVAFVRSTGGRVRVLLAIDREGRQLFDGEPALLAEHRPGRAAHELTLEGADRIDVAAIEHVRLLVAAGLAQLVEDAFDQEGTFDGQRLLGRAVAFRAPDNWFDG